MFTGLIECLGLLTENQIEQDAQSRRLTVKAPLTNVAVGESIAINGTCLTVVKQSGEDLWDFQVSPTTLSLTTLGQLSDALVNVERSVTPSTRLGGHWVQGHVDTVGSVVAVTAEGDSHLITVQYDTRYDKWVLPQGSVALDGVSLTVVETQPGQLQVTIIPHTWEFTNIHTWRAGWHVNVEFDVLGKYLEHLSAPYARTKGGPHEHHVV